MSATHGDDNMPKKILKNRQTRTTDAIINYLREVSQATTPEIYEYLNNKKRSKLSYGCTNPRLVNLLGKMIEFECVDEVYLPHLYYKVKIWRLAEWV